MAAHQIEGKLSEYREVLGRVVFPSSVAILVEDDIEHPMQLVLDPPMGAHDAQQLLGGNIFGEQEVAHLGRLRTGTEHASREVMRASAATPGNFWTAAKLVSRRTVARRHSQRS